MPRDVRIGFTANVPANLTDADQKKIYNLLHEINDDHGNFPFELIIGWPNKKVQWLCMAFTYNKKYLSENFNDQTGFWKWLIKKYEGLLDSGYSDVDIIRSFERDGYIELDPKNLGYAVYNGNILLEHKAINFAIKLSLLFPDKIVYVLDPAGYGIYAPIGIQNGKAKPILMMVEKYLKEKDQYDFSENRIKYYQKLLAKKDFEWVNVNNYIRPIQNYEAFSVDYDYPMTDGRQAQKFIEMIKQKDKEFKEKGINTDPYGDSDYYPDI